MCHTLRLERERETSIKKEDGQLQAKENIHTVKNLKS